MRSLTDTVVRELNCYFSKPYEAISRYHIIPNNDLTQFVCCIRKGRSPDSSRNRFHLGVLVYGGLDHEGGGICDSSCSMDGVFD